MDLADLADIQLEAQLRIALQRHAERRPDGPVRACCRECGVEIPRERRELLPRVGTCVDCAEALEIAGRVTSNAGSWWF